MRQVAQLSVCFVIMLSVITTMGLRKMSWRNSRISSSAASRFHSVLAPSIQKVGVSHPSYDRVEDFTLPEYGLSGTIYNHRKSGAQIISIIAPDDNKVFGITFRTPPSDSTGVPHILEHSVLCGSRKFPVKEPFLDLLKGSLQNFLNAMTYPDRTCYPVASTNTKDFYNLIHVYLDAVLHPRAVNDPRVLQQEGWHYELDNIQDPLKIKGVVYNEMKGVYSSPDALMGRAAQQALFPKNTYGVDSGGDPDCIPDLTFDGFRSFHQNYYHPSNSRVFFYGDDDPLTRLNLLEEYLSEFDRIDIKQSQVHIQPKVKFSSDISHVKVPFPLAPGTPPKHMVTVNWLLNEQELSPKEALALEVLDYLLLGTSTSTLRKALVESNLGESVTGGGLSDELLQASFSTGLKGVDKNHIADVQTLIHQTLEKVAKDGFEMEAIQAAINTLEFRLREFNTGGFPKGLLIMLNMNKKWIYDKNPLDAISFEEPLKELKVELLSHKTPLFQELINKFFLQNTHKVTVEMIPDPELESKQASAEETRLANIKSQMSQNQLTEIVSMTQALREAQEKMDTPEQKATLPKLDLADINRQSRELPLTLTRDNVNGLTILTHPMSTSRLLYLDIAFDYSQVAFEDLELLPLFTRLLMESGTATYSPTQLTRMIGTHTGGISISFHNDLKYSSTIIDPSKATEDSSTLLYLVIRGKSTEDKLDYLFSLTQEILLHSNLNNQKRAVEMLRESKVRKESSVISNGHSFASTRLAAKSSFLGYFNEMTGGLTSVRNAGKLLEMAENDWENVYRRLEKIRKVVFTIPSSSSDKKDRKVVINLTADESVIETTLPFVDKFYSTLPSSSHSSADTLAQKSLVQTWQEKQAHDNNSINNKRNEAFVIPSLVNYVGLGGHIYSPGETVKGSLSVATRFLSTGYMWNNIRVQGGAYGGFARFSEATGRFVFLSYRDPNLLQSLQIYQGAAEYLQEEQVSSEEILQGIIASIGDLDSPMSPDQKGFASMAQFLSGELPADRQRYRDEILQASPEDLKELANRLKKLRETGQVVVFGSQQAIDDANAAMSEHEKLIVEPAFGSGVNK